MLVIVLTLVSEVTAPHHLLGQFAFSTLELTVFLIAFSSRILSSP